MFASVLKSSGLSIIGEAGFCSVGMMISVFGISPGVVESNCVLLDVESLSSAEG